MQTNNYISIQEFGDLSKEHPDLLITTLHGSMKKDTAFMKTFGNLEDYLHPDDIAHLQDYMDLECDIGTDQLADRTAELTNEKLSGKFLIRRIKNEMHRGFLDGNRVHFTGIKDSALRLIWYELPESMQDKLREIHAEYLHEIWQHSEGAKFILDIHSMWSQHPIASKEVEGVKKNIEICGALQRYIQAFLNGTENRPINLITHDGSQRISDKKLNELIIEGSLKAFPEWHASEDNPYDMHGDLTIARRLVLITQSNGGNGSVVDIPKGLLTNHLKPAGKVLREEDINISQVERMADVLSTALAKRILENSN
ncbi:hypothetical protein HOD30_04220 [Candidatus Peregrinibacteria bacterium]|jgi:hypothetical protein|nr:hypothetical protein [Candidatus Peregrinibacteria bacterium]MBT4632165.1 hypothetical protein [Candidatus Peregrinibacteria bacterium]MBT5516726.1 hypothetical protein [Candidatus Peregrinibacteria bacterium]MBT5824083.1 hypothetical protein [Candidatus Peregrinibacteria bacterium]